MREEFVATATLDADRLVDELGRIYRWYNESAEKPFRIDMTPVLRDLPVTLTTFAAGLHASAGARDPVRAGVGAERSHTRAGSEPGPQLDTEVSRLAAEHP